MQDLLDKISEHKERIQEVMDLLTQDVQGEDDFDDILGDLDEEIANEKALPDVTALGPVPTALPAQRVKPTEEDLEGMLAGL